MCRGRWRDRNKGMTRGSGRTMVRSRRMGRVRVRIGRVKVRVGVRAGPGTPLGVGAGLGVEIGVGWITS